MAKKSEVKEEKELKNNKKEEKSYIHDIEVKMEGETWTKALDQAFKKKQQTVKVDGFRKGKVPRSVYEKRFGKESLYLDAVDLLVDEAYQKAMKDSTLTPVAKPSVDLKDVSESGCTFVFRVITKPEVKIKKYKGLNIKPKEVKINDDEIQHEMGHLLERYTELVSKDENSKVENGDVAIIDFEGFKDGVAFDGGKGENYSLEIGSNTFIPGFEEQIIGMKVGEKKDLNLTFPKDYGAKDLAGKDVVFKVKVNEIKVKQTRELDEDFFEDLGIDGVDSEDKLKNHIKENLKKQKEVEVENDYVDELLDAVGKNVEVDIPEEMVEEEVDRLMHRFEHQVRSQGLSLDLYYQFSGSTEADLRSQMEKDAYNNVLYRLMLEEIQSLEDIHISDEEAEKEAEKLAKDYQLTKEEMLKEFGGMEFVKYDLEVRKVIDKLKELNK